MTELKKAVRVYIDSHPNSKMNYPEWDGADAYDAFVAGAEWQAKQSPWISVEERLPEHMQAIWVRSNINNYHPLRFCNGKFYTSFAHQTYDGSVTHWMPIPE